MTVMECISYKVEWKNKFIVNRNVHYIVYFFLDVKHIFSSRNIRKHLNLFLGEQGLVKAGLKSPRKKSLMHLQSRFSTVNNTSFFTQSCQHNSNMTISKGRRDYSPFPIFAASAQQCLDVVEVQHHKYSCICQHSSVYFWLPKSQKASVKKKSEYFTKNIHHHSPLNFE